MKLKSKIILSVIITFITTLTITVTASILMKADNIAFSSDKTNKTNVSDSLDELYTLANTSNNPWAGMEGVVYYLGTDKNYDISALIENGTLPSFLDYTKLTADNFIVGISSIPDSRVSYQGVYHKYVSGKTVSTSISKSYDSSSGVLNISGGDYEFHICIDDGFDYCSDGITKSSSEIKTYLVLKSIN